MQKFLDSEIKNFDFSELNGRSESVKTEFKPFTFGEISGDTPLKDKITEENLRSERAFEKQNNFKIDGAVRDSRGLARQEQSDIEGQIQAEVKRRLEQAYSQAYKEGLQKGIEEGRVKASEEQQSQLEEKMNAFADVIASVKSQEEKLLDGNRHEIYEFVKRFTKWIILKEVNEKIYLENLLEKLILELNSRKNLIIKVGRENFSQMPEVVQTIESRLGQLSNVRVEIVPEIKYPGIILESENGLIDGSMEGIFQNIDKIFEQVVGHE